MDEIQTIVAPAGDSSENPVSTLHDNLEHILTPSRSMPSFRDFGTRNSTQNPTQNPTQNSTRNSSQNSIRNSTPKNSKFIIPQHIDTDIIQDIDTVVTQQQRILASIKKIDDQMKHHAKNVKNQTCEIHQLNFNLSKLNNSIKKVEELDAQVEILKNKTGRVRSESTASMSRQISGTLNP